MTGEVRRFEMSYERAADLAGVRAFVRARAGDLGLPERRADLLTLAVSELATNTLQHTAGGGRVRLRVETGRLLCDVIDQGQIDHGPIDHGPIDQGPIDHGPIDQGPIDRGRARRLGRSMPPAAEVRGRGMAIVERICDEVGIEPENGGTRVRLTFRL